MECEHDGCRQVAEFRTPMEDLCSDCIQMHNFWDRTADGTYLISLAGLCIYARRKPDD